MAKRHLNKQGNFESLFLRLEELVLANSGEDEFAEIFKLLIAKIRDELRGKEAIFKSHGNEVETYEAIILLLREAEKAWPGILEPNCKPLLTPEHLQVCVEAMQTHKISRSSFEVMDGFFEFLVSRTAKGIKGQYFTPRHVVEMCVRLAKPEKSETILDPACGSGGFLIHVIEYLKKHRKLRGRELRDYCRKNVFGFDISNRAIQVAKALMILAGDGHANIIRLNSLLTPDMAGLFANTENNNDFGLTIEDVCRSKLRRHSGFDVILTNPPFAGEVRENGLLEQYIFGKSHSRVERDILFLERCVRLLKPGGRMAIVLPHNKFASTVFSGIRKWLSRECKILAVIGLGRNTFLPHTHQKTSVLFAQKRVQGEVPKLQESIFFAVSEKDGKDTKGMLKYRPDNYTEATTWDRIDHDLDEIVEAYANFISNKDSTTKGK